MGPAPSSAIEAPDGLPIPPRELLDKVIGPTGPVEGFLSQGELATEIITGALARQGIDLSTLEDVLDWGCGCGRVLRFWAGSDGPRFYGSDYNPELVAWCRENLPHATVTENGLEPPLRFADESFDLVYALSVFTHLREEVQHAWMREIRRVLRPDGLLFFTTVGDADLYLGRMTAEELQRFSAGELVVRNAEEEGSNRCAAFAPSSWVKTHLLVGYELLEHMRHGARCNGFQDGWLVRKTG